MTLPSAKRAQKVVYLPQSLPQGVHLHALESVIVAKRASGNSGAITLSRKPIPFSTSWALRIWQ
jgi:iron complex transport system ATP-binding protein